VADIAPVNVTKFEGNTICAKRGGSNFLHTTRPDFDTGNCPGVLIPCSENTSLDDTICMHPDDVDSCPITNVEFSNRSLMHEVTNR